MKTCSRGNRFFPMIASAPVISGCLVVLGPASHTGTGAEGTTTYWNQRWNFCIEYPNTWVSYEPFDGSGVELTVSSNRASASLISVGALPTQPRENDASKLQTPLEGIEAALKDMTTSGEVQDLKVKEKVSRQVLRHPGATVTFSYRDRAGITWLAREFDFAQGDVIFRLGLIEHPADATKFEPVFQQVTQSLKLDCKAAH